MTTNVQKTSIDAYEELKRSGRLATQKAVVLLSIIKGPGRTRQELSVSTRIPINAICGRVNELLKDLCIIEEGRRKCSITNIDARMIWPVVKQENPGEQLSFL
jgi:hypothetical protein